MYWYKLFKAIFRTTIPTSFRPNIWWPNAPTIRTQRHRPRSKRVPVSTTSGSLACRSGFLFDDKWDKHNWKNEWTYGGYDLHIYIHIYIYIYIYKLNKYIYIYISPCTPEFRLRKRAKQVAVEMKTEARWRSETPNHLAHGVLFP